MTYEDDDISLMPNDLFPGRKIPKFYQFGYPVQVRYADVDAMNHVNNAVYLTYLEMARTALWREHVRPAESARDYPFIVARAEIDYRTPICFGEEVKVFVAVIKVGIKSFTIDYEIRAGARVAAEAKTVQVYYDYAVQRSVPIPDEIRNRLKNLGFHLVE